MVQEDTIEVGMQSASYVTAYYVPDPIKLYKPPSWVLSSCINTAKWMIYGSLGEVSWGNADSLVPVDGLKPTRGVIIITNEGNGHIGVISSVSGEYIHVQEGNWISGKYSERELRIDDPKIKGFWLP